MGETWGFIDSGHNSPAFNMALDELMLEWLSKGEIGPTIRFYGWSPAGISIGRFQDADKKIDFQQASAYGAKIVRRQTGGRAVLHDQELTYSVVVPETHPAMPRSVKEAYLVISKGLLEGFRELGIDAEFAIPETSIEKTESAVCFDKSSWYELLVDGKKAAGSAQMRRKGMILQHGSIPIEIDSVKLFDLFSYPSPGIKQRARDAFKDKAISINAATGQSFDFDRVKGAFKKGFEQGLGIKLEPLMLSEARLLEISQLAETKYKNLDWSHSTEK
ncbi:lipoate--protein ligase family protein [Planococcus halotolerans]|uniref:Octanoyltransferase n=1 Tax=Planococcus halotolerans TaxID=2233542 RepID=A0A365KXG0_9BACL|nr:biotin/lipoate A/B protein ligase family protein [Planococcus halotolerans]QHJ72116.1 octanoyltransferase [Planococcus halotolerans]RAZ77868.1 octanoyltransferase [Planococcus halotolerans]